jgi:hypothetical protein
MGRRFECRLTLHLCVGRGERIGADTIRVKVRSAGGPPLWSCVGRPGRGNSKWHNHSAALAVGGR